MKKLILALITLISAKSMALTVEDCQQMSNKELAAELVTLISLGGDTGLGNAQCLREARELNVPVVGETFESIKYVTLKDGDRAELLNVEDGTEENSFENIANYQIIKASGAVLKGSFGFFKHETFANPANVQRYKCANISTSPSIAFIQARCR